MRYIILPGWREFSCCR